ncbi:hypothetical protein HZC27_03640 [Candidatus Roizmanbacteria bacterium]|nr:hypothetical protein [Candidatus Roizmanbacteria bacterium]
MALTRERFGGDTPVTASTSSVGALVWPPIEASEQRKKGVLMRVLESKRDLLSIINEFNTTPFGRNEKGEDITRKSGRIFVSNQALREVIGTPGEGIDVIETVVPLRKSGIPQLEDCSMVYLGSNHESRRTAPNIIAQEMEEAEGIFQSEILPSNHAYQDFEFNILTEEMKNDATIQSQYDTLYQAFGWGSEDVAKILTNENNVLVAAFRQDELVSAGLAERCEIPLERNGEEIPFVMYEITEAATKQEYRGNGLYTQVAIKLMEYLATTDVNLAYAESNLQAPGVLKSAHRQGRHSGIESAREFGLPARPLEQHVRISAGTRDVRPESEKNDLLVTFMPREEILQQYGET